MSTAAEHPAPDPAPAAPSASAPATAPRSARPAPPIVPPVVFDRVPWKRVGLFVVLAYAIFAVFAAPFWFLPGGIANPLFTLVIAVGMWAPALASIIMAKGVERTNWRTRVGLRFRGRWRGIIVWSVLGVVVIAAVVLAGAVLMVLRGVPGDLTGRTWLGIGTRQISDLTGTEIPPVAFVLAMAFNLAFGLVITVLATLGEEIGWRGWLWPALWPLGRVRAALVMGVIWALWHTPVMVIGYNYPGVARWIAIPFFILPCIAMSLLFCGLADRAGGSPLPSAWAHSAVNSLGSTLIGVVSTLATGAALNPLIDTQAGIIGVVLLLIAAAVIVPWRARRPIVRGLPSSAAAPGQDAEIPAPPSPRSGRIDG
ncbi:CPBP family intramembrane metalloprotease [Brachybacterium halotolerans subsp. kimchii]|uniref:CPBP family intramembrane glutamic endopeptidase n=1 Tax=Brachybacterium halotolerans TaxID=2795215 RepID=UPI001E296A4E|nr:CPBP family intramembrane glutamic endopeptidase [Brachybacterium halotolerans]UEJ82950.1 CPBP family intramembrane metalloprotease [Brachybacterium halotolerans subsp. kimchii]